jgi:acetate kinase
MAKDLVPLCPSALARTILARHARERQLMHVLTVNSGSSTLKLSLIGPDDAVTALSEFLAAAGPVDAVAHRMVHGGPAIRQATLVDDELRADLEQAAKRAPLHMPPALRLLDATRELVTAPQVVCVDTAFHAGMPAHASTYAVPAAWRALGVRRYGFHGLSYAWASGRCAELLHRDLTDLQIVIAHVGSGVSACAVRAGHSVDTSMGFTPQEGAVMATRSGSVDPGAMLWLQTTAGIDAAAMAQSLEHESGLLALCGSSDMRDVERGVARSDPRSLATLDVFVHSLCRTIGGLATSLDRLDALVFTGGIGEHSPLVRSRVCDRLALLNLPAASVPPTGEDAIVGERGGGPSVVVIAAREDAQMAREARRLLLG